MMVRREVVFFYCKGYFRTVTYSVEQLTACCVDGR